MGGREKEGEGGGGTGNLNGARETVGSGINLGDNDRVNVLEGLSELVVDRLELLAVSALTMRERREEEEEG